MTIPIPLLNVLSISWWDRLPCCLRNQKIGGVSHEPVFILTLQLFGTTLGIFSVKPPPVIWAIPLTLNSLTICRTLLTYILVGVSSSSPIVFPSSGIWSSIFSLCFSKQTFLTSE